MKHVSQGIYDYNRNKLCDIYDSSAQADGQAKDIILTEELTGWKEISFTLPKDGHRWQYVQNDCLLRVKVGDDKDWFVVKSPRITNNGKAVNNTVKCAHLCSVLKTKNLYLVLDDENGIGNIEHLAGLALKNTGWTQGEVDTFLERDGETEKVRSLSSSGKRGSYQLIQDICKLFNAYPIYHGDTKTVDLRALENKGEISELSISKNLNNITVEKTSDDIITRLYVEGEYGDNGYVGIDSANPTGLSYLLNFDYYRSAGLFTPAHEAALETYLTDMPEVNSEIRAKMASILQGETLLNDLWGQCNYVIYVLNGGTVEKKITGGTVLDGEEDTAEGDKLLVFKATGNYREITAGAEGAVSFAADDVYAIKFITLPAATIGARQVAIESKEKMIATLRADKETETDETKKEWIDDQIKAYQETIQDIYNGTETVTGLYDAMRTAVELAIDIDRQYGEQDALKQRQDEVESAFAEVMGDMLKDGYWSNQNYAPGQEQLLYWDALDRMNEVSKPTVKYTVGLVRLPELMGYTEDVPLINAAVHLLDDSIHLNDVAYVSKRTIYQDDPRKGSIEISNENILSATAKSFENVLGKVTELADLVDQKNTLYERARAINANGTLPADRVVGTLDIQEHTISSTKSNWYSDKDGSIVFESLLGDSAFKLSGDGIMLATTKTGENWDWHLYGGGAGFDISAMTVGTIDANRISDGSIGSRKLGSGVGKDIDISQNQAITTINDPNTGIGATKSMVDDLKTKTESLENWKETVNTNFSRQETNNQKYAEDIGTLKQNVANVQSTYSTKQYVDDYKSIVQNTYVTKQYGASNYAPLGSFNTYKSDVETLKREVKQLKDDINKNDYT